MKKIIAVLMTGLLTLLTGCSTTETLTVNLIRRNEKVRVNYTPDDETTYDTARITLYAREDGKDTEICTFDGYSDYGITDLILYYWQENGGEKCVINADVALYSGDKCVARGSTNTPLTLLDDFYQPEENRVLGTDIPLSDVQSFTWEGYGEAAENNFCFKFYTEDGTMKLDMSYWADDSEGIPLIDANRDKLLEILDGASLYQPNVKDPDIEILDETAETFSVTWPDMTDNDSRLCIRLSDEQREQLLAFVQIWADDFAG